MVDPFSGIKWRLFAENQARVGSRFLCKVLCLLLLSSLTGKIFESEMFSGFDFNACIPFCLFTDLEDDKERISRSGWHQPLSLVTPSCGKIETADEESEAAVATDAIEEPEISEIRQNEVKDAVEPEKNSEMVDRNESRVGIIRPVGE